MRSPHVMRRESHGQEHAPAPKEIFYRVNFRGELLYKGKATGFGITACRRTRSELQLLSDMLNDAGPSVSPTEIEADWLRQCEALGHSAETTTEDTLGQSNHVNHVKTRNGKAAAVCCCCNRKSRPVEVCRDGEPDLWRMPQGWSTSPFPADHVHRDGSVGSFYTCPACNARLRNGETLPLRAGGKAAAK